MQSFAYPCHVTQITPEDFEVRFRDVPEAITGGVTKEAALTEADDCLAAAIEGYIALKRPLPVPSAVQEGDTLVVLDWNVAARALLADAMARNKLSKSALARRIGQDEKVVRRMLAGDGVKLEAILTALKQLGLHPALSIG